MIDALELAVPWTVPQKHGLWANRPSRDAGPEQPYASKIDFRSKLNVIVYSGHRHPIPPAKRHYKLQFTEMRLFTSDDLFYQIGQLFMLGRQQIKQLKVMRVDFAADTLVPVQWYRENCRAIDKQQYEEIQTWHESTRQGFTTIIFGKRPDLFRIYDKVEETKKGNRKRKETIEFLHPGILTGAPEPTITRVERQCSAAAVPTPLKTLGDLLLHSTDFNPFEKLRFNKCRAFPDTQKWTPHKLLMNLGLKAAVEKEGLAVIRARMNRSGRKAKQYFDHYSELLHPIAAGMDNETLTGLYQKSTVFQLNVPVNGRRPQGGVVMSM